MTDDWWTPTVEAVCRGILADRAFDRCPILADALEDAGYGDGPREAAVVWVLRGCHNLRFRRGSQGDKMGTPAVVTVVQRACVEQWVKDRDRNITPAFDYGPPARDTLFGPIAEFLLAMGAIAPFDQPRAA